MNEVLTFERQIIKASFLYCKVLGSGVADLKLEGGHARVLLILLEHTAMTQSAISKACNMDPAATSRMLYKMEESGLVVRNSCRENRRCYTIQLTEAGVEEANKVYEACTAVIEQTLVDLPKEELVVMKKNLDLVISRLMNLNGL